MHAQWKTTVEALPLNPNQHSEEKFHMLKMPGVSIQRVGIELDDERRQSTEQEGGWLFMTVVIWENSVRKHLSLVFAVPVYDSAAVVLCSSVVFHVFMCFGDCEMLLHCRWRKFSICALIFCKCHRTREEMVQESMFLIIFFRSIVSLIDVGWRMRIYTEMITHTAKVKRVSESLLSRQTWVVMVIWWTMLDQWIFEFWNLEE